jgi:pyruvate dehydrogenase E2 component (dihydrolipoamide acetyltransferase)
VKEVIMPKFGFTQETAQIVRWLVKPGEKVEKGQPIAEVTTDKVNMEVEAPDGGMLEGVRYQEGDEVPVTEVICYIAAPGEQLESAPLASPLAAQEAGPAVHKPGVTPLAERIAKDRGVDPHRIPGSGPGGRVVRKDVEAFIGQDRAPGKVRAAPAARRLASELGIDLGQVRGSGPQGRIQSSDVQVAFQEIAQGSLPPAGPGTAQPVLREGWAFATPLRERIPVTGIRRTIAERLQKSAQEAPHIIFDALVDVTACEALRSRAASRLKDGRERVSLTAVIAKAAAWALERHPLLNAWLLNGAQGQEIHVLGQVNLGIAVALETGLIVPVLRDAGRKGILQLSREINDLAERARSGKLSPDDVAEGTFTLSNLGMYGIDRFTAIINPPQVGILAISRVRKFPVVDETDHLIVRPVMALTLSVDHRVVDGAVAARFMADLREALENPDTTTL